MQFANITSKEGFPTNHSNATNELKLLEQQIQDIRHQISTLPQGKLIITKNKSNYKWYVKDEKGLTYLPKSQRACAMELARKKYLSHKLNDLTFTRNELKRTLQDNPRPLKHADQLLLDPRYHELLASDFTLTDQELIEWSQEPYEKNANYSDQLIHRSISGNIVRSKSEVIIDMTLFMNQIPFRYEAPLIINSNTFYPDFTILHPRTKQLFYWEHFGMMDNEQYAQSTFSKLALFTVNGIIPSINLLTTYETSDHPLNPDLVTKMVRHYFL